MATELPVGFTLDQPAAPPGLPPGFKLDAPPATTKPGIASTMMGAVGRGMMRGGPVGVVGEVGAEGIRQGSELLDRAAYGVGGAVTDVAARVLPPELAAGAGFAANVATQAIPTVLGGEAAKLASPAFRGAAERLLQSALKPSTKSLKLGTADKAVTTMLDEGINVSRGGVEKLKGKVDVLNDAITEAIKGSGATVDKGKVASRIQDVVTRIEKTHATPQDALKDVEKVYSQFLENKILPAQIPVEQAQRIKQGIYQMLREKYGTLGSDTVEAQKAIARGLKEELASAVPGIEKLNAKESALINALKLAEHRALLEGNKNPGGLTWLSHSPAAFAAFMADKSALFKSVVARMINANQRTLPGAAGSAVIGGYEAATQNQPQ